MAATQMNDRSRPVVRECCAWYRTLQSNMFEMIASRQTGVLNTSVPAMIAAKRSDHCRRSKKLPKPRRKTHRLQVVSTDRDTYIRKSPGMVTSTHRVCQLHCICTLHLRGMMAMSAERWLGLSQPSNIHRTAQIRSITGMGWGRCCLTADVVNFS